MALTLYPYYMAAFFPVETSGRVVQHVYLVSEHAGMRFIGIIGIMLKKGRWGEKKKQETRISRRWSKALQRVALPFTTTHYITRININQFFY